MITAADELKKTEDLLSLVRQETGKDDAELDDSIESLGMDSLEFVALIQAVQEQFGCTIPDAEFVKINTVRDIRERI